MSKNFFTTLIAASLVLLIYSMISWMATPIHKNSFKYTAKQDSFLASFRGLENGRYALPIASAEASSEEQEKMHHDNIGKPMAIITYCNAMSFDIGSKMAIGLLFNLLAVFIVLHIIQKCNLNSFGSRFSVVVLMGIFLILQAPLMEWNWMNTPEHYMIPEIIDGILSWICAGLVIAWLYKPDAIST